MSLPVFTNPPPPIPLWRRRWSGPAVVAAAFIALLVWTRQRLADVLVDFGVQLYVPWQLSEGKVLYRDIAHYTGPLSIYYCAAAFRIFGVNLRVLELANLPILIGIVIAIYYLANRLGGRLCAVICGLSFLALFAFAHISIAGNYNYVTPYEYDYTHATLLCLACVIFLHRMILRRRKLDAAAAGFLAGMIFLTRSEFFVAAMGAAVLGFIFLMRLSSRAGAILAAMFLLLAAAPPIISVCLLHLAMPWRLAIHGTMGMWPALLRGNVSSQHFYLHSMGLDDLSRSVRLMVAWTAAWCIPITSFTAWAMQGKIARSVPSLLIAFVLGAAFVGWKWLHIDWPSMFRPLPVAIAAVVIVSLIQFFRDSKNVDAASLAAIVGVMSLVLLVKVFFYARIIHYGCWLAMPATMLVVIALFGWIPSAIRRRDGSPAAFIAGIGGAWAAVVLIHLVISAQAMKRLTVPVGSGADQFWADSVRGTCVNNAVVAAEEIPASKTIDCFPEGIMINYLSRRRASTPYVNFNPPDLLLFGEDEMIKALNESPPDFIFLVHKDTSEFGERFFGHDYAQKLNEWIEERYVEETLPNLDLGAEPFRDNRFGIRLMVRRPPDQRLQRFIQGPDGPRTSASLAADSTSGME
jgi:hypothetical protein